MTINWKAGEPGPSPFGAVVGDINEYVVHFAASNAVNSDSVQRVIQECIDKAISFFETNVTPYSEYFLIEWDPIYSTMTLVVTDRNREHDSRHIVKCRFESLDEIMKPDNVFPDSLWESKLRRYANRVKTWTRDCLRNSSGFKQSGLTPAFYTESRELVEIL